VTPLSTFVGREDVQERLRDLAVERRLVTVTGPGGVGKTRLVQQAVGDAAFLVELAPLGTSGDVGAEAAAQLGHGSLAEWAMTMADQSATIVLDSCEHVLDGAASIASTLLDAGPDIRVVATSREPLALDGEHLLVLEPLDKDAAVDLFVDRTRAAGGAIDPDDPTVVTVCRRLDGLPLAIELAAARGRTMTPAELLDHLDQRFELLSGLAGAIAVSYDLLDADEQRAFRRLSAFSGPFTLEVAHELIGDGGSSTLPTLDQLAAFVDRSLLVTTTLGPSTRYHLLDSLRDYGRAQLEADDEVEVTGDALVTAMTAEAVRAVARAGAGWSAEVLAVILDQFPNSLAAVDWCLIHDETPVRAHALMTPLWAGVHHARHREVAAVGAAVLERWPDETDPGRAQVQAIVANARLLAGDVDDAIAGAEAALAHPDLDPLGRIVALRTQGIARRHVGDLAGAAESLAAAHDLATFVGADSFAREIAIYEAGVTARAGKEDDALGALVDIATEATEHDEPIAATWARVEAANLLLGQDRVAEVRRLLADALQTGLDVRYHWSVAATTRLLALADVADDGWASSGPSWRAAIDAAAATGESETLAETIRAAAGAARAAGEAVADDLWALVPAARPLTALPELHPDESSGARLPPVELLRRIDAVIDAYVAAGGPSTPSRSVEAELVHEGDSWRVSYGGRTGHVAHRKGLDDLAQLLERPDHEIHCLELMGAADTGDAGPALDDTARRAYQERVRDLQQDIDEATDNNDPARAERAELELDALVEELSSSLGLGGKARSQKSAAERARSAVTWRIRAAVRHLEESAPELSRHLQNAVRTGTWCTYRPETAVDWTIRR
jgi:predicted ATPase